MHPAYKYTVKVVTYENSPVGTLRHFCMVCEKPLHHGMKYWYLQASLINYSMNRWACSEICAELLCLADGEPIYKGYSYGPA